MVEFNPDYTNIVKAARNIEVERIPLYEHIIAPEVMEAITGKQFKELYSGNDSDLDEYFRVMTIPSCTANSFSKSERTI